MDWQWWLSFLADVLSVVGFLVTVFVAWRVNAIRKEYLLIGRVPEQAQALLTHADELPTLWNDPSGNRLELVAAFAAVEVDLRSMQATLAGDLQRAARQLRSDVREYQGLPRSNSFFRRARAANAPQVTHEQVRTLYTEIIKLADSVEEGIRNMSWRR